MKESRFIDEMNPFLKIIVLTLITLIVSLDFYPFLSGTLIITALVLTSFFSSLTIKSLLTSIKPFIFMSLSFVLIIIFVRAISSQDLALLSVIGLGFKILTISVYSTIFVKTTDSTEFVISLIKYLKVNPKYAYAFLTAYRFLPTFKEEYEIIRHAHLVRGVKESKNLLIRTWNMKQYILPMLATAVRKGIRISMAMETRAFGKYKTRTYYRKLTLKNKQIVATSVYILIILMTTFVFYINELTNFGLKYMGG